MKWHKSSETSHPETAPDFCLFYCIFRSAPSTTQETTPTCLTLTAPSQADRAASEPKGGERQRTGPLVEVQGRGDAKHAASVFLRCEITSREYCDFMKGYFHEEATLCSQVSRLPGAFQGDL